jgi:flagellar hook-associated protein 1
MGNIFGIGLSGLEAAQAGIQTASHNIANQSTPGYSRQQTVQSPATPQYTGAGFVGQGVDVSTVKRIYSQFLVGQVQQTQAQSSQLDTWYAQIQQINNVLANPSAGLAPALQDFFSAVQTVSSSPASIPARQAMLSAGSELQDRFQSLDQQFTALNQSVNDQLGSVVSTINGYASQIASLNQNIAVTESANPGQTANDLRDQRDQLVTDLNKLVQANVVKQDNGDYNVFIGNGQSLVVGSQTNALTTVQSNTNPSRLEVAYTNAAGTTTLPESSLTGGQLGGLIAFRAQTLEPSENALGRVAVGLESTFNAQHELGQDLGGNLGGAFFAVAGPTVSPATTNTGNAVVAASVSSASALTTSDYRVQYDANAANWTITRLSDGKTYSGLPQTVDGVDFSVASGNPAGGDQFLVRPTAAGAGSFSVAISDPSLIAAAAPISASAAMANTGTGTIAQGTVDAPPPPNANLQNPVTISFTSPTAYTLTDTVNGATATGTYTAGADIAFNGWTTQISGVPATGDTFTVGPNTNGTGDNRNALLLGALQTRNTLAGGATTYNGAYGQLVSDIGNKTRELQVTSQAQGQQLANATQSQQSYSGVNLDEEAASLLQYQQAYQANARVLQIASQLFASILQIGQ